MTALLLATDEVHAQPVSVKHFCLKDMFFAILIIFINIKTLKRSGNDQRSCYAPTNHSKAIKQLSFYQSFDGPAPIPSMASMPLDDITITDDHKHT